MSSFSRTCSNEKLPNQNEAKKSTNKSSLDKRASNINPQINPQINISPQSSSHSNLSHQSSQTSISHTAITNVQSSNLQSSPKFKMSISPSLSSANSNQSSVASSVNSLNDNQEELTNLTNLVKKFRQQLRKFRRTIDIEINLRKDKESSKECNRKEALNKDLLVKDGIELSKDQSKDSRLEQQQEIFKAEAHARLADVLQTLKIMFAQFAQIESADLFACSQNLIDTVKEFPYNDQSANLKEIVDRIDRLAETLSNRVSEYAMEADCSSAQCSQAKPKSSVSFDISSNRHECDNNNNNLNQPLTSSSSLVENSDFPDVNIWNSVSNIFHKRFADTSNKKEDSTYDIAQAQLSSDECEEIIQKMDSAVKFALQNAKLWSNYTKEITNYINKRINYEMENSKNLCKIAETMRPILKESDILPFNKLYLNMLDLDIKNRKAYYANNSLILGHKFCEPLNALRKENDNCRKACKYQWTREFKRLQESVNNLKKSRSTYIAKKLESDRAKQALKSVLETSGSITSSYNLSQSSNQPSSSSTYIQATNFGQSLIQMETTSEQIKLDKKRKTEEDAAQKAMDAEVIYRNAVNEVNERAKTCENVKNSILNQITDLDDKFCRTLSTVTGDYLRIQKLVTSAEPIDFQRLLKKVENYSFGNTTLSDYLANLRDSNQAILNCFKFVPYETSSELNQTGSMSFERNSDYESQTESIDFDTLPANLAIGMNSSGSNTKLGLLNLTKHDSMITGEELDNDPTSTSRIDSVEQSISHQIVEQMTKVAQSHHFQTVRNLSKCKECDITKSQAGLKCVQCGISVHKECVNTLIIRCGYRPLPERTNIFTLDLCRQSEEGEVPFIVKKCIQEINRRGLGTNGLYRVPGVKSMVEKLCADFEIGGNLVDLTSISPFVLTSVLKFYFRELPIPLLTFRLHNDFISIGKRYPSIKPEMNSSVEGASSSQSLLKELRRTLNLLPKIHLNTLDYLMQHLKKVADNEANNMPANNLGIVFGPTLLRTNESTTSLSTMVDYTIPQNRVIELLILNYNELFGGNLVNDDEPEFDEIIEQLKTIAGADESENDEDETTNAEIQLDNLIQDLNRSELMSSTKENTSKDYRTKDYVATRTKHHSQSKDSETYFYMKSQNSMDKAGNELKLSSKHYVPRPSLQELKKQFLTETTSTQSPFQSFGADELAEKRSLNELERLPEMRRSNETKSFDNSRTFESIEAKSRENRESKEQSTSQAIGSFQSKQSGNQSSKSPSTSTLQLFKTKDDQRERYV